MARTCQIQLGEAFWGMGDCKNKIYFILQYLKKHYGGDEAPPHVSLFLLDKFALILSYPPKIPPTPEELQ